MDAKKKSAWRTTVSLISKGLWPIPSDPGYEYYVACWLNEDRIENKAVVAVATAIVTALSKDDVPEEVVDAMVDDEDDVERVASDINAKRQHAAVLAKYRQGF